MATDVEEKLLYMADEAPTTFHPWSRLPKKLKINVLSTFLSANQELECYYWEGDEAPQELVWPLIDAGNQELKALAEYVYYTTNTFNVNIGPRNKYPIDGIRSELMQHAHMVRRLRLCVEYCTIPDTLYETLFRSRDAWREVVSYRKGYKDDKRLDEDLTDDDDPLAQTDNPKEAEANNESIAKESPNNVGTGDGDASHSKSRRSDDTERKKRGRVVAPDTAWQRSFINLRHLHVDFYFLSSHDNPQSRDKRHCCLGEDSLARLQKFLARTEMDMKAASVDFCFEPQYRDETCRGHAEILEDLRRRTTRQHMEIAEQESSESGSQHSSGSSSEISTVESGSSSHPDCETDSSGSD
jgi:hypothetical protein